MTDQIELTGLEKPAQTQGQFGHYGAGPTELETRAAIAEIEEENPVTGARRTIKQLAISLAMSIDKGNAKGRAIANEASQLFVMMRELSPPEAPDQTDPDNLTDATRRLLDAFATAPRLDRAPQSDGEEL